MHKHVRILGILNIVWGSLGVMGALILVLIFGGVIGLLGFAARGTPAATHIAIPILSLIGTLVICILLITSLPAIIIGIGLVRRAGWSRVFGIIISALHLLNIPFGTALGIYGLWVLLSSDGEAVFAPSGPVRIAADTDSQPKLPT